MKLLDEASGRDQAALLEGDFMLLRETIRPYLFPDLLTNARKEVADRQGYPNFNTTPEEWAENDFLNAISTSVGGINPYVGAQHGQSSGNETCLMRYTFARIYEALGRPDTYYLISKPGDERAGVTICTSPPGTGIQLWSGAQHARQATGEPNVWYYGDYPEAWTSKTPDGSEEWLKLTFAKPVRATAVRVRQNYNPGAISKVEVFAADGRSAVVWSGRDSAVYDKTKVTWFIATFEPPPFPVQAVKLTFDSINVKGFNEIDAVQLVGDP
jgi:hypothetical protein